MTLERVPLGLKERDADVISLSLLYERAVGIEQRFSDILAWANSRSKRPKETSAALAAQKIGIIEHKTDQLVEESEQIIFDKYSNPGERRVIKKEALEVALDRVRLDLKGHEPDEENSRVLKGMIARLEERLAEVVGSNGQEEIRGSQEEANAGAI